MVVIESVTIRYFRSVYTITIKDCKDINVITGLNDSGKSNIVKAINLFFNGRTDWGIEHQFHNDFSYKRREIVRKETVKGQQFISITVKFQRGDRMVNSLPPTFSVTRRWDRNGDMKESTDIYTIMEAFCSKQGIRFSQKTTQTFLSQFLHKIRFIYVPAIKDESVFNYILRQLQMAIFDDKNQALLGEPIQNVNSELSKMIEGLHASFKIATGISSTIAIPKTLNLSQGLLNIDTQYGKSDDDVITLNRRGDGIKSHYIPQILHYISSQSTDIFIWGFEEPENSYEYRRCLQVADEFKNIYSKSNQIFITSHSPAFYGSIDDITQVFRVNKNEDATEIMTDNGSSEISEELGYAELYKEFIDQVKLLEKQNIQAKQIIDSLKLDLIKRTCTLILTEGPNDVYILNKANSIVSNKMSNVYIRSCDTSEGQTIENSGGDGGCQRLRTCLESFMDNDRIVIGLFDSDREGLKAFSSLNLNFEMRTITLSNGDDLVIKKRKFGKIIALCLPVPRAKLAYGDAENFSIEFYFDDIYLDTEVDGHKLVLVNDMAQLKTTSGKIYGQQEITDPAYRRITEGKTFFAKNIVHNLPDRAFMNFDILFEAINTCMKLLK